MPSRGKHASPSPIRTSPLLSEEDRQFLAGDLTADTFLETARRRAAAQTWRELGRYHCTATIAGLVTAAFLGAGLLVLTAKMLVAGTVLSVSGLTVILAPAAYKRSRKAPTAE